MATRLASRRSPKLIKNIFNKSSILELANIAVAIDSRPSEEIGGKDGGTSFISY